jgi:hypothetical protein
MCFVGKNYCEVSQSSRRNSVAYALADVIVIVCCTAEGKAVPPQLHNKKE